MNDQEKDTPPKPDEPLAAVGLERSGSALCKWLRNDAKGWKRIVAGVTLPGPDERRCATRAAVMAAAADEIDRLTITLRDIGDMSNTSRESEIARNALTPNVPHQP